MTALANVSDDMIRAVVRWRGRRGALAVDLVRELLSIAARDSDTEDGMALTRVRSLGSTADGLYDRPDTDTITVAQLRAALDGKDKQ